MLLFKKVAIGQVFEYVYMYTHDRSGLFALEADE